MPLRRLALALAFTILFAVAAWSQGPDEAAEKQKGAAEANLKAAKLTLGHAETADLLVYAPGTPEKVKALAAALQKTHDAARKALRDESKEPLWSGKLTAYVFADARQYRGFVLQALKRPPEGQQTYALELQGDTPAVLTAPALGEKPTDAQMTADAAALVAAAALSKKVGATAAPLPDWLTLGFGRAAHLRTEGNAPKLTAHKAKVKAYYGKTRGQAFKPAAVWGGQAGAETELLSTSLAEFLAFGPGAEKFPAFVQALRPTDENPNPTPESAMAAVQWQPEALEAAWQKWAYLGK